MKLKNHAHIISAVIFVFLALLQLITLISAKQVTFLLRGLTYLAFAAFILFNLGKKTSALLWIARAGLSVYSIIVGLQLTKIMGYLTTIDVSHLVFKTLVLGIIGTVIYGFAAVFTYLIASGKVKKLWFVPIIVLGVYNLISLIGLDFTTILLFVADSCFFLWLKGDEESKDKDTYQQTQEDDALWAFRQE